MFFLFRKLYPFYRSYFNLDSNFLRSSGFSGRMDLFQFVLICVMAFIEFLKAMDCSPFVIHIISIDFFYFFWSRNQFGRWFLFFQPFYNRNLLLIATGWSKSEMSVTAS